MKKSVAILSCLLIFGIILVSAFVLADNDNGSSGRDDESGMEDEENSVEMESELEIEDDDEGMRIRYKEKYEAEFQNGTKIKYEYEIRERKELSEQERQRILEERNELRIQNRLNQSECPLNCSCDGSSMKCRFEDGSREMIIRAGQSGNQIIQVKDVNASTQVRLYKSEDGEIYGMFRDNETRRIILPDEAQARIEAMLRERIRLHNENITLDENGTYQIRAEKRARFLFMFPINESVAYQIDAETGEVIKQRKSWWGFLARDVRDENNSTA